MEQELKKVESISVVQDGKLVGEYDFYNYLKQFEGKRVRWKLELIEST